MIIHLRTHLPRIHIHIVIGISQRVTQLPQHHIHRHLRLSQLRPNTKCCAKSGKLSSWSYHCRHQRQWSWPPTRTTTRYTYNKYTCGTSDGIIVYSFVMSWTYCFHFIVLWCRNGCLLIGSRLQGIYRVIRGFSSHYVPCPVQWLF